MLFWLIVPEQKYIMLVEARHPVFSYWNRRLGASIFHYKQSRGNEQSGQPQHLKPNPGCISSTEATPLSQTLEPAGDQLPEFKYLSLMQTTITLISKHYQMEQKTLSGPYTHRMQKYLLIIDLKVHFSSFSKNYLLTR